MNRSFTSVQELNRFRKELMRGQAPGGADAAPLAAG
jgi:hypothetical protein